MRCVPCDPPDPPPASPLVAKARRTAERAARDAAAGRIAAARRGFAAALKHGGDDVPVLFLCYQFHFRAGEYEPAEQFARRRLAASGPEIDSPHSARAYTNLGLVLHFRGQPEAAEAALTRALEIDTRIGNEYGIARDLGNLSLVPEKAGDLERAEALLRQSLGIAERIGAEDIVATKLANLGDIALARRRTDEAREFWRGAVAIFERIGPVKHRAEFKRRLAKLDAENPRDAG